MSTSWWRMALGEGREPSDDQVRAIEAPHVGRRSVDAGAGTGKTTTLALRALALIESGRVAPDQIVVVTFTKKAAAEIGARIADTLDRAIARGARFAGDGRGVRCTTIHALAADLLREFAFDFDLATPPRAIADGEAYGIFHDAFAALLERRLDVDTSAFPIAELNRDQLERDLGKLALRLKNHGISPRDFEARASVEAERFGRQAWGQLWTEGAKPGRRTKCDPKNEISAEVRALEARRERSNIRVVAALFEEFDRRLRERGVATYGDLIGETTRLLAANPAIVARLRARWRYAMIDESQDSSDQQLSFLDTVFGRAADADAAGMMPVGDRRQAIYGFNGAGEDVMARLTSDADGTHALVVNRRSSQEIVDAAHAVLEAAGIVDATTPKLEASAGHGTLATVRVQNFWVENGTVKENVAVEAAAIAYEIERLLGDAETKPSDIAILVRRRTHANAYVAALNERGITAALDRRSGLFAADEIRDALAWMSLLLEIGDRRAAVRVLQSPACGLSDAATIALAAPKDWLERILRGDLEAAPDSDTRERLARVRALLVDLLPKVALPLPLAVAEILRELPIAASYARIGATIGAQAIVNLRSFHALAEVFASEAPAARLTDFVDDVKRRILYDDEPPEAELDLDGVRVMTVHQAKGLEWPYVFVACATKNQYGTAGPSDAIVGYDLATGAFALKNDIDGRETFRWLCSRDEHDPATGERRVPPLRKRLAEREQARVFYVALTRAKRRVYVTTPTEFGRSGHAPCLDAIRAWAEAREPGVDLRFALDDTVGDFAEENSHAVRVPELTAIRGDEPLATGATSFAPRVSFTSISVFEQCPRRARLQYRLRLPDLRDAPPRYVGLDERSTPGNAARLGSLTHRVLEIWGRARIDGRTIDLADALADALGEIADVSANEAADALARAAHAVAYLAEFEILGVEETFAMTVGETSIEGAIDLIARGPDGRTYVIDYKTGRTDDEHYALQLALYARAAGLRFVDAEITGAILRLTADAAVLSLASGIASEDLSAAVAAVGSLQSDTPNVGRWCDFCPYNGAPCQAPRVAGRAAS